MSGEAEPRRSVRATKGQHTKAFDDLEPAAPKRRQTKKTKKAQEKEKEQSQDPEEIIRCVCGATEQDEDSGEAWISCETCFVWQHNVCVGVSSYEDEIPDNYWCEQCKPENHKELLDGIARGERPWEARRKAHEEEAERKKKKGGRKKGKRVSDPKEDVEKDTSRVKTSPTPDVVAKEKKEPVAKQGKRKAREDSHDVEGKSAKIRRVSENETVPVLIKYTPPEDLAAAIPDLPGTRVGPAKALKKSLTHIMTSLLKSKQIGLPEGSTVESMADRYALQIERGVFDTHPLAKGQKEYSQQIKSLTFNLKNNPELMQGLLRGIHSPMTLAIMTSEQLATVELQRQNAEMKAKAEKQSILYTAETGPRVRRTHKGEEVVEDESLTTSEVPLPAASTSSRPPGGDQTPKVKRESISGDQGDIRQVQSESQQHSPTQPNFDIGKVFSAVKTPTAGHHRRPSAPVLNTGGPGIDPDVDRMLQDETESPPYSPTEETAQDPDIVWSGSLAMSSIADFQATAKHIGGANFASFGPWSKLVPRQMTVAGRITQQSAIEYLCSLRYSSLTDIVVLNITPVLPESKKEFNDLINYFISKNRYGVVGNKVAGNVRDTYLVPVPPGEDGHPEFMLNLVDNYIPKVRTEPLLLAVFVYRNEPEQLKQILGHDATPASPVAAQSQPPNQGSPTPIAFPSRSGSMSGGPAFSPATPQGAFPTFPNVPSNGHGQSATPVPIPQPPHTQPAQPPANAPPSSASPPLPGRTIDESKRLAQEAGRVIAYEVLGSLINVPTVQFLLPQAFQMSRREWEVIKTIFERDTRAREDLKYLADLLEKEGAESNTKSEPSTATPATPVAAGGGPRKA
ncbi:Transcription factor BYE1-like protein [Cladobotryum mycophilum]|uniref:Transcription factor BYE1 n=1 Tax=Cladobotryum mycophilum TaxID=491253 RepID=A0ABR0SXI2_9HYPO